MSDTPKEKKETLEPQQVIEPEPTPTPEEQIAALGMEIQQIKVSLGKPLVDLISDTKDKTMEGPITKLVESINLINSRLSQPQNAQGQDRLGTLGEIIKNVTDAIGKLGGGGGQMGSFERGFVNELMSDMGQVLKLNAKEMLYAARKRTNALGIETTHLELAKST